MDRIEFNNVFWPDFKARFPNDATWVAGHSATYKLWFDEVFAGLGIMDCMAVSKGIMNGELEGWAPRDNEKVYDRQQIPAVYARHVGRMRFDRRQAAEKQSTLERERWSRKHNQGIIESDSSMSEAFKTCREMTKHGATEEEIDDYLCSFFDVQPSAGGVR